VLPDIADLTLEQKIGQMCMFGFHGRAPSQNLLTLMRRRHLGNVIVFARNFSDAHNLRALCREIHAEMPLPPLISIDQEGGVVTRITEGASLLPGNMAAAATGEPELAFAYGAIIGRELRALGVNLNLAPVLDVNQPDNPGIGVRSFGDSPEIVTQYGIGVIRGLQSQYVFATGKHFPGKGAATLDTHHDMAVINRPLEELERIDIAPFREAVRAGVACLMTSHAGFPAFTPGRPVMPGTFTPEIMTDYLRNRLGFTGVLLTDDLEMGAATKSLEFAESVTAAVQAGADLLCVCHDFERQNLAIDTIIAGVRTGTIPERRINESVRRIFSLKRKFAAYRDSFFMEDIDELVSRNAHSVHEIVEKSITVYDTEEKLPLALKPDDTLLLILPRLREYTPVEELRPAMQRAEQAVIHHTALHHENTRHVGYTLPPAERDKAAVLKGAQEAAYLVFCSYNAHLDAGQSSLLRSARALGKPLVLFMLRNPFDRVIVPDSIPAVAVYAPMEPLIREGINRLFPKR